MGEHTHTHTHTYTNTLHNTIATFPNGRLTIIRSVVNDIAIFLQARCCGVVLPELCNKRATPPPHPFFCFPPCALPCLPFFWAPASCLCVGFNQAWLHPCCVIFSFLAVSLLLIVCLISALCCCFFPLLE